MTVVIATRPVRAPRTASETAQEFRDLAAAAGVASDVSDAAWKNLTAGRVAGMSVSGWMASGKDTVGPDAMAAVGRDTYLHVSFAKSLKVEFDQLLDLVRAERVAHLSPMGAATDIARIMEISVPHAAHLAELLWNVAGDATAYDRTPEIRLGLQYLGTEVRRSQHPDYWVWRAAGPIIEALADGFNVLSTDCRFPNEVIGAQALGMFVPRLEITRETQEARLASRDGLAPDPAALYHASETALDDYDGFDLVVDNNGPLEPTVAVVADAFDTHCTRLAS